MLKEPALEQKKIRAEKLFPERYTANSHLRGLIKEPALV